MHVLHSDKGRFLQFPLSRFTSSILQAILFIPHIALQLGLGLQT